MPTTRNEKIAAVNASPRHVWVWEEHCVGSETGPSARVFATQHQAMAAIASQEEEMAADDRLGGFEHTPQFDATGFYADAEGGCSWVNDSGDWRELRPVRIGE
jgi:hypothetical protein